MLLGLGILPAIFPRPIILRLTIRKTFKIDVYELLSNYAFYLTSEYVSSDGFKLSNITIKDIVNMLLLVLLH